METATAEIISPNISAQIDESQQNINKSVKIKNYTFFEFFKLLKY